MDVIVPIVEGDGEKDAVPELLRRLLWRHEQHAVAVARPKVAHGITKLCMAPDGSARFERFLRYACLEPGVSGILVLIDADDDCPLVRAETLSGWATALKLPVPVAIVVAKRGYENWFLASVETLAGKPLAGATGRPREGLAAGASFEGDPEAAGGAKARLTAMMPPGRAYKETLDQCPLTRLMDLDAVSSRCRSFRRLVEAVGLLLDAMEACDASVSPDHETLRTRLAAQP